MNDTLYIVMPAYNEADNIRGVVSEWYPMLSLAGEQSRMVISDGGSTDDTLTILYHLQKEYPKLVVDSHPGTDHGTKVIWLYKYASREKADWIFQTDSDGQTLAKEFPLFWELRDKYDAVIGDRRGRGDGLGRSAVELVLRIYLKFFFGKWIPDANAPYRLMNTSVVDKYIGYLPEEFNLPNAVLTECFKLYGESLTFHRVTFRPRQGGVNYMNWKRILRIGWQSISSFSHVSKTVKQSLRGAHV